MTLSSAQLDELSQALADRLYVQVAGWHLYLGDAKLARPLAEELPGKLPLSRLIPAGQLIDLEDILESFSS